MPHRTQLYLITPPAFDLTDFTRALDAAFEGGEVAAFRCA